MSEPGSFDDFLRRLHAGDPAAAERLVREYEGVIRAEARRRISDPRLRRAFDSMDVCQAVLKSFFEGAAGDQFALDGPEALRNLLRDMTRRKTAHEARKEQAGRRDVRRVQAAPGESWDAPAAAPSPSRVVSAKDLLSEVRKRLTAEEQQLFDRRTQGKEWAEIAEALGGTPSGRRKQLQRGLDRVTAELGIERVDLG